MELILIQANAYYGLYFSQPPDLVPRYSHSDSLADVFDVVNKALDKLLTNDNQFALSILNEACTNANKMFLAQPLQIIVQFSACFSRRGWSQYGDLQSEAMSRLTEMAQKALGPNHIVTTILDLMPKGHISRYLSSRLLRLTADAAILNLQGSPSQLLDAALHLTLLSSEIYRDIGEESPLLRHKVVSPQGWDRVQDTYVPRLYKLGYLRSTQQQPDEALRLRKEVIELTEGLQGLPLLKTRMWTFNCIGHLYAKDKLLEKSAENYRSALRLSLLPLPMNEADRLRRFEWLTQIQAYCVQSGKVAEVAELQVEFSSLWKDYNKRMGKDEDQ
ncbi:uncharacterized protein A1O5_07123 [Cladophialophora psammophila CBS 110553]|uniref:Uncharacterized protein n=1 Tax=Cladophialophora psammophila CBS 110553 TaxID=1182543 RepID=W9WYB5_9EURO|nr:uncharacterized protein A1O5_07123 [Cladophialophora psammophila CBS 110553]EXJ70050.1 hypothetical protein A1O5_07123 [Cladophialophora psammophila CBS 110553]